MISNVYTNHRREAFLAQQRQTERPKPEPAARVTEPFTAVALLEYDSALDELVHAASRLHRSASA